MRPDQEPDELDRLIEARRLGDSDPSLPNPLTESLADLASDLEGLALQVEPPDQNAVWQRVSADIDADQGGAGRSSAGHGLARSLPAPRFWGPALAASLALIAVLAMLISEPTSSSAAFVQDVEALSVVATRALEDNVVTAVERGSLANLTASLVATIDRRPDTLTDLEAGERASVLATLDEVVMVLTPVAEVELADTRTMTLLTAAGLTSPVATDVTGAASPEDQDPLPDPVEPARVGAVDASVDAPVRDGVTPPSVAAIPPSVASSVNAIEDVTEAIESSQRGHGPPFESGSRGRGAGSDDDSAVCSGLTGPGRGSCERAVNAAVATCGTAADEDGLEACEDAAELAEEVCEDLLSKRNAKACKQALERLTDAAEHELEHDDEDHTSSRDYENITPSDRDRDDDDRSHEDSEEDSDDD